MGISVKELSVQLQEKIILHDISVDVSPGQFVGIVGPNGSGKSTLLRSIYRAIKPSVGKVMIHGKDVLQYSSKHLAKEMAVLKQENTNLYDFTVEEMVLMGRTPHKRLLESDNQNDRTIIKDSLLSVGMWEFRNNKFLMLSGGEKQRVLIARALAQQPNILLLDEPTNHLDIHHQIQLLELVKKFNLTVMAALHDLNLAANYCDTVIVIHKGKIVAHGTPREVFTVKLLEDVFHVKTSIQVDPHGNMHIMYVSAIG
jgi:iron complex transport system ATP-binding protein